MRASGMGRAILMAGVMSCLGENGIAQQPETRPGVPRQEQNSAMRPEHRRLAFLVGNWEEEVNYADGGKGRGRWQARPELGHILGMRYQGEGPEGEYRALGVLTYHPEEQAYRMWWFDSAGGIGEYRGDFADENSLVLEHRGTVEGRAFRERISYVRLSATEVRTRVEQAWDSENFKLYLEGVARRSSEGPGPRHQP